MMTRAILSRLVKKAWAACNWIISCRKTRSINNYLLTLTPIKMKKIAILFTMLFVFGTTFTSCREDKVSDDVEDAIDDLEDSVD